MNKEVNLLNIFESIQKLQKMITTTTNKLFIDIDTGRLMSLSKYKTIKKEMQNIRIPPFYIVYSLKQAAIQKLVRSKMELSKINKVARLTLNSTVALGYYSPTTFNEKAIVTLIESDCPSILIKMTLLL
jgi:hypothetical protein